MREQSSAFAFIADLAGRGRAVACKIHVRALARALRVFGVMRGRGGAATGTEDAMFINKSNDLTFKCVIDGRARSGAEKVLRNHRERDSRFRCRRANCTRQKLHTPTVAAAAGGAPPML